MLVFTFQDKVKNNFKNLLPLEAQRAKILYSDMDFTFSNHKAKWTLHSLLVTETPEFTILGVNKHGRMVL